MALSNPTSLLVNGSGTDAASYTTASVSPSANALLLLFVSNGIASGTAATPTSFTGTLGLTWNLIVGGLANAVTTLRGTWYWAKTTGSPPTGTITINFGATQSSAQWHITQILGADLTSPIVQSDSFQTAVTDNPGITLSALQPGSITLGAVVSNIATAHASGSNFTTLSDSPSASSPTIISSVEYANPGDPFVDWTLTSNVNKIIFAIEVAAAASTTNTSNFFQFF